MIFQNRNLVMPVGLQSDSNEDVAELCCQWSDAAHVELHDHAAITGSQLGAGECDVDRRVGSTGVGNQQQRNRRRSSRPR